MSSLSSAAGTRPHWEVVQSNDDLHELVEGVSLELATQLVCNVSLDQIIRAHGKRKGNLKYVCIYVIEGCIAQCDVVVMPVQPLERMQSSSFRRIRGRTHV